VRLRGLSDLDQVAAGVVENRGRRGTHLSRFLGELDAERVQAIELRLHVVDGNDVNGIPSATSLSLNGVAAAYASGSITSSVPARRG
jgi:hypothetical protein